MRSTVNNSELYRLDVEEHHAGIQAVWSLNKLVN